jgi:superfamily II DNA helicase RecQ
LVTDVTEAKFSLIFATPEILTQRSWMRIMSENRYKATISAVAVDEAHNIIDWNTFRPKYNDIPYIKCCLGSKVPWALFTATTTEELLRAILLAVALDESRIHQTAMLPDRYVNIQSYSIFSVIFFKHTLLILQPIVSGCLHIV